jgi:hypothetical protein
MKLRDQTCRAPTYVPLKVQVRKANFHFKTRAFFDGPRSGPSNRRLPGQSLARCGPWQVKHLIDAARGCCLPLRELSPFRLTSFFFLCFAISRDCAFSAFFLALRSAFALSAASCRDALIKSLVGSSPSLSDSSDSSSSSSESEDEEPSSFCCFCCF